MGEERSACMLVSLVTLASEKEPCSHFICFRLIPLEARDLLFMLITREDNTKEGRMGWVRDTICHGDGLQDA